MHTIPTQQQRHPILVRSTRTVVIAGERFELITEGDAEGRLRTVSFEWDTSGTTTHGLVKSYTAALTTGLRHGVPLSNLLVFGAGMTFVPYGGTSDPDVPWASSIADYISRRLAMDWLGETGPPSTPADESDWTRVPVSEGMGADARP